MPLMIVSTVAAWYRLIYLLSGK